MTQECDICGNPILAGQPRFGGTGTGGKDGAPFGQGRHWQCHTDKFGKPAASPSISREAQQVPKRKPIFRPKVKKGPYNLSPNAGREWKHTGRVISQIGKRRIEIECPFCFQTFWAYVWSISGGGKKCPNCGAIHASFGTAHPIEGNEDLSE